MDLVRYKRKVSEDTLMADTAKQKDGVSASINTQKEHRGLSASLDYLLDIAKENEDFGAASDSDDDGNINVASKKQKQFAKKFIRHEKKKEKAQKKKLEKNMISMDDYLKKQYEFKMWLYEEKSKNAGEIPSPKLKALFKQFVRLWNKKKLMPKYYRCSDLPESPAPFTKQKCNFLTEEAMGMGNLLVEHQVNDEMISTVASPFVTFGKTPPKKFSKKLQLYGTSKNVALISVVPVQSPTDKIANKENSVKENQVPVISKKVRTKRDQPKIYKSDEMVHTAMPYKVSVFPWALDTNKEFDLNHGHEVCCTSSPQHKEECWPSPPKDKGVRFDFGQRTHESPHVPPPPPPRIESLLTVECIEGTPQIAANYADPCDNLNGMKSRLCGVQSGIKTLISDYQEPLDCIGDSRAILEYTKQAFQNFSAEEPDLSMYFKPVTQQTVTQECEVIYAKPMKKGNKIDSELKTIPIESQEHRSHTVAEIMDHTDTRKADMLKLEKYSSPDPQYETLDEFVIKDDTRCNVETVTGNVCPVNCIPTTATSTKFTKLTKSKKTILAASTEKIYETYLSFGRKATAYKRSVDHNNSSEQNGQNLDQRFKPQPGMCFDPIFDKKTDVDSAEYMDIAEPVLCTFKPVDHWSSNKTELGDRQRSKNYEYGIANTPTSAMHAILSSPSFESLCNGNGTYLTCKSMSLQSLPTKSGSSDRLSSHSPMSSLHSCTCISYGPGEKSSSLQSLHSEKSLSPVKEESEAYLIENKAKVHEVVEDKNKYLSTITNKNEPLKTEVCQNQLNSILPGKANALKHGIDLSVYLLGTRQLDNVSDEKHAEEHKSVSFLTVGGPIITSHLKNIDTQSKIVTKDNFSLVRKKAELKKKPCKLESEGQHQVVHDLGLKKKKMQIENGITSKHQKTELSNLVAERKYAASDKEVTEPKGKKHCGEKSQMGDAEKFLETDLDTILTDITSQPMKMSKSQSGFDDGLTGMVVTDIW